MGTQAFRGADVLVLGRDELRDSMAFWQRSSVCWTPARTKRSVGVACRYPVNIRNASINRYVNEVNVSTATPDRWAVLSSREDQVKGGCAQYCGTRTPV